MEDNRGTRGIKIWGFLVTGIVTAVALAAMVGVYRNMNQEDPGNTQLAQEVQETEESTDLAQGVEYEDFEEAQQTVAERSEWQQEPAEIEVVEEEVAPAKSEEEVFSPKKASFDGKSDISWPVEGNVLMNYSMDKTVYFATLDQYKYNPAIIIQAPVNTKVVAGVAGTVIDVDTTEETGVTVTVDLGNGYQAVYGQLKEVKKEVGDGIAADDVIGYIAEPTKYYNLEGSNLYFAMTKDEKPVNPMEFLK